MNENNDEWLDETLKELFDMSLDSGYSSDNVTDIYNSSKQEIITYISTNYTPNSEVEKKIIEARIDELNNLLDEQETFSDDFRLDQAIKVTHIKYRLSELNNQKETSNE